MIAKKPRQNITPLREEIAYLKSINENLTSLNDSLLKSNEKLEKELETTKRKHREIAKEFHSYKKEIKLQDIEADGPYYNAQLRMALKRLYAFVPVDKYVEILHDCKFQEM